MRLRFVYILLGLLLVGWSGDANAKSTRQERRLITEGNKQYLERKFVEAAGIYEEALKVNPGSTSARYNLGLSQIRQVTNPQDTTPKNKQLLDMARKNLIEVGQRSKTHPGIASKAYYNLGNLEFNSKEYGKAIDYYKQALRIDPNDDNARRNLRIAQKQQQKQDQQDQQQDQQNQQDKQDQQNQQQQQQNQQQQPKEQQINQQTAERILQAMDNKENQTRSRVNRAKKGENSEAAGRSSKRW